MSDSTHPDGYVLQAYHDGELNDEATARIETHCRDCVRCRNELAELQRLDGLLADIDAPELPRPVWPALNGALRKQHEARLGPAFAFSAAAVCAAGITIGILLGPVGKSDQSSTNGTTWEGPSSMWSGGASASLLEIHLSDMD